MLIFEVQKSGLENTYSASEQFIKKMKKGPSTPVTTQTNNAIRYHNISSDFFLMFLDESQEHNIERQRNEELSGFQYNVRLQIL